MKCFCKFGEALKVINKISVKFDWVFLKIMHLDVNSDINSQPFPMQFCRHHRLVLRQLPCKFGGVSLITSKVINEISVKFDWVFLKVIHLDVNSDVNSQPFPMQFCRHHRLVLRQLPCKFGEDWLITSKVNSDISVKFSFKFGEVWLSTLKVINKISVKFDRVFLKVIYLDVNSDVNS